MHKIVKFPYICITKNYLLNRHTQYLEIYLSYIYIQYIVIYSKLYIADYPNTPQVGVYIRYNVISYQGLIGTSLHNGHYRKLIYRCPMWKTDRGTTSPWG